MRAPKAGADTGRPRGVFFVEIFKMCFIMGQERERNNYSYSQRRLVRDLFLSFLDPSLWAIGSEFPHVGGMLRDNPQMLKAIVKYEYSLVIRY